MSTDASKIRSKLAKIDKSLDELEAQLEPLFSQSLPETLLALDTIQQAKLQVVIPYVVYDLVFAYLKSRGIDPKTHRVVAELERVRTYFDKIKHAEELDQKRRVGLDKDAANRFIKHAIAQAKNAQLVDESSDDTAAASSSSQHDQERVPVKITSKMMARAEYEKELQELGSEEDEDLEVFDEEAIVEDEDGAMELEDTSTTRPNKGKGRAEEESEDEKVLSSRGKRPRVDPFSGYDNSNLTPQSKRQEKKTKFTTSVQSVSVEGSSQSASASTTEDRDAGKAAKKAKRKAKKP